MPATTPDASDAWFEDIAWVRGLARAVVSDPHAAEDLAQDVLVSAVEHPPAEHIPWHTAIATRVRNGAISLYRTSSRRKQRESWVARAEAAEDTQLETSERLAIVRELVDCVDKLDEPYRSVVRLRYFDELMPRDIARRTGRKLDTVKVQLKRGLEQLRAELDRKHGGKRDEWMTALLPLARLPEGAAIAAKAVRARAGAALLGACTLIAITFLVWRERVEPAAAPLVGAHPVQSLGSALALDRTLASELENTGDDARHSVLATRELEVQVVLSGSHQPVPNARLEWWPLPADKYIEWRIEAWFREGTLEAHTRMGVISTTADDQGRSAIAGDASAYLVTATIAGAWGKCTIRRASGASNLLEIRPDADVPVHVLDVHGAPVGDVRVQLSARGCEPEYLCADTDRSRGIAVLRHAGYVLHATDSACMASARVSVCSIGFDARSVVRSGFALDRANLPSTPIRLQFEEPFGMCAMEIHEPDDAQAFRQHRPFVRVGEDFFSTNTENGRFVFPAALGWNLTASCDCTLGVDEGLQTHAHAMAIIRGPRADQDWIEIEPTREADPERCRVRGRLLDEAGLVLAGTRLGITVGVETIQDVFRESLIETTTDRTGHFDLRVLKDHTTARYSPDEPTRFFVCRVGENGEPDSAARCTIAIRDGEFDLGDVQLACASFFVAGGTVVDESGAPVPKAMINWQMPTDEGDGSWRRFHAGTDGRFVILGEGVPQRDFWIVASAPDHASAPQTVTAGRRDLTIALGRTSSISGRVVMHPSMSSATLYAAAVGEDFQALSIGKSGSLGDAAAFGGSVAVVAPDGTFSIHGLAPGPHCVAIHRAPLWEKRSPRADRALSLCVIHHVEATPEPAASDPRLNPLDLGDDLRSIAVRVRDAEGEPVPYARIEVAWNDELNSSVESTTCDAAGACRVFVSGSHNRVTVRAREFLPCELQSAMRDIEAVLTRCPDVTFRIGDPVPVLGSRFTLSARLSVVDADGTPFDSVFVGPFDSDGVARQRLPYVGTVQIDWLVTKVRDATATRLDSDRQISEWVGRREIEIRAEDAPRITLSPPDPERLAAEMRGLDER